MGPDPQEDTFAEVFLMAARDHLEDFWEEVQIECVRRGIEVGSPKRGTEMSVRAATGVAWTIHHRSDHLRPGIILRPTNRSNPKELVRRLAPAIERVEERESRDRWWLNRRTPLRARLGSIFGSNLSMVRTSLVGPDQSPRRLKNGRL